MPKIKSSNARVIGPLEPRAEVNQEIVIRSDGNLEIPWIAARASDLILAVWDEITDEPFPIKIKSGQLYCG